MLKGILQSWRKWICGFVIPAWLAITAPGAAAQTAMETQLLERVRQLEEKLAAIEARLAIQPGAEKPGTPPARAATSSTENKQELSSTGDPLTLPGFAAGTTINFLLDGYYEYNLNQPTGRVNLLRPLDPTANSFTLNQAGIVVERAPDPSRGKRFGMRMDFMFGQTTEALAGNPANEPRPSPYRNLYQAYGTYVLPLGTGLTVDFGRFSSPLGIENSFAKDQFHYTRSLLFTALPFYHMGFRTSYKVSGTTTATWMLVNGANQTEDFNGFKSNNFMVSTTPVKNLTWTGSYYVGEENRDLIPSRLTELPPGIPTQPGLSVNTLSPRPDGRTHIVDTYATWAATPKLTLAGEGDYILNRTYSNSAPTHLLGGAAYARYQFLPAFSLGGRFEVVKDKASLSGANQTLKEATMTATIQPKDGFQVRLEYRHDFSNQPFFFKSTPDDTSKTQDTLLLGLIWWFGGKQGPW